MIYGVCNILLRPASSTFSCKQVIRKFPEGSEAGGVFREGQCCSFSSSAESKDVVVVEEISKMVENSPIKMTNDFINHFHHLLQLLIYFYS